MATPLTNDFTEYAFETPQEERSAKLLTPANLALLSNLLAAAAVEKVGITYDIANPIAHVLDEARLMGQIQVLRILINGHHDTMAELAALADDSSPR